MDRDFALQVDWIPIVIEPFALVHRGIAQQHIPGGQVFSIERSALIIQQCIENIPHRAAVEKRVPGINVDGVSPKAEGQQMIVGRFCSQDDGVIGMKDGEVSAVGQQKIPLIFPDELYAVIGISLHE